MTERFVYAACARCGRGRVAVRLCGLYVPHLTGGLYPPGTWCPSGDRFAFVQPGGRA